MKTKICPHCKIKKSVDFFYKRRNNKDCAPYCKECTSIQTLQRQRKLKLAFEIQGIFHYEPIYGQEKLEQIQNNDLEKVTKCKELSIKLIQIDTRNQKRFTEKSAEPFLNLIKQFI